MATIMFYLVNRAEGRYGLAVLEVDRRGALEPEGLGRICDRFFNTSG